MLSTLTKCSQVALKCVSSLYKNIGMFSIIATESIAKELPLWGHTMANRSWDDDGVDGGPSSIDVLLEWLSTSGNAKRWRQSAGKAKGSRADMIDEIHDVLLSYGINHRTLGGIRARLRDLEHQLEEAEQWLKNRGIQNYDVSRRTEDAVLQICPLYPGIQPLLRPKPVAAVRKSRIYSADGYGSDASSSSRRSSSSSDEDEELPKVGCKRGGIGGPHAMHDNYGKRPRVEHKLEKIKLEDTKCVAVLEAEPNERREFFKLELQVKRDEAILTRAKARKELLDMGIHLTDVNRLLPL